MRIQITHCPDVFYIIFKIIDRFKKFFCSFIALKKCSVLNFDSGPAHSNFRCETLHFADGILFIKCRLQLETSFACLESNRIKIKIPVKLRITEHRRIGSPWLRDISSAFFRNQIYAGLQDFRGSMAVTKNQISSLLKRECFRSHVQSPGKRKFHS